MDWELPVQVPPEHGADEVPFPWAQARSLLGQLGNVVGTLGAVLWQRPGMVQDLHEWAGPFRDEFDDADGDYTDRATSLWDELVSLGDDVVDGANKANEEQIRRNEQAEEAAEEEEDDS